MTETLFKPHRRATTARLIHDRLQNAITLASVGRLIEDIAKPQFERSFLAALDELVSADHFVGFLFNSKLELSGMMAASRNGADMAQRNCRTFQAKYWKGDLSLLGLKGPSQLNMCGVTRLTWDQISDPGLQRDCYRIPRIIEKMSIPCKLGSDLLVWAAYRDGVRGFFRDQDERRLVAAAEIFSTILTKHLALRGPSLPCSETASSRSRLKSAFAADGIHLSERELDVCVGIAEARTSDEIARELAIKPTSVVTYRKRIYAKLGVRTQSELLARTVEILGPAHKLLSARRNRSVRYC